MKFCLRIQIYNTYLYQMKWRKQNKIPNRNNQTLDSFINGITVDRDNSSKRNSSVIPKIKVPPSSGLQPIKKPVLRPFLYPEFPQFRQYQYSIAIKCITQNTMVCLPTGLGKTHIASVLILNFHLWFPQNLIFFLAPTKPLVDQQSMTLSNFRQYIPPSCIFSLTGSILAPKRVMAYQKKKILFCTPQTLQNDLREKRLDAKNIILIIFDQAHKAVGNYSYANIVRMLDKEQFGYRVIGLSATPGNDSDRIQEVLQNLQISNMIVKSDEDQDVKKYIKNKNIQPIIIQNTSIIKQVQQTLQEYIKWPLKQLLKMRLFDKHLSNGKYGFNPKCCYTIISQINQRIKSIPNKYVPAVHSAKMFLKFLSDSLSLLRQSGYQSFKRKFVYVIDQADPEDTLMEKIMPEKVKFNEKIFEQIRKHPGYMRIKQLFSSEASAVNHPKLQKLRQILYNFLSKKENIEKKSKVIIFANLRYTCHQIHKYLNKSPFCQVIKSQIFLGQAKTTVQTRQGQNSITQTLCLSQKDQINLIKRYKANEINTLVSTSIGEEGLDIGEVDAIFCYEGGMSTIRMIQRMGRTGRKRDGSVYVLLMEGKQLQDYERATKKTAKMKKTNNQKYKYYSFNPVLFQEFSEIPIQFIEKPIEQTISKERSDDDLKQIQTKKKKNKLGKEDKKKTKKKIIQQEQTKIQQASFSQQNEPVASINNQEKQQGQSKEKRYQKYFKIIGKNYPQIPNQFIQSDGQEKIEEITEHIDNYCEQEEYTNYSSDQDFSSYSSNNQNYTIDLKPISGQFAKLFDFQTLYQDQLQKNEEIQSDQIEQKQNQGSHLENQQNQGTKDQINISPKENLQSISDQQEDSQQQLFKQYQRLKEKQNKQKQSQEFKETSQRSNEILDCQSQDSSQIIDKHQLHCFSNDKQNEQQTKEEN